MLGQRTCVASVLGVRVTLLGIPLAFAVAALIERDDMVLGCQCFADACPRGRGARKAMQQHDRIRAWVAPLEIAEAQPIDGERALVHTAQSTPRVAARGCRQTAHTEHLVFTR